MTTPFADASKLQLDPRLGALYRVTHELAIRGSAYRAFRAPTLNELYRPFQVGSVLTAANDRLRPETLWGGELGAQLVLDRVAAQATAFWNRLSEPIANVTLAQPLNGATRQRQNLGASRIVGADVELTLRPADAWTVRASHSFSSAHVTSAPSQPDLVGKRLLVGVSALEAHAQLASRTLGVGDVRLTGRAPNGQCYAMAPKQMWLVADAQAHLHGRDLGPTAPLLRQARLGDFRMPQRGIAMVGSGHFETFDPARHVSAERAVAFA